MKHIPRYIITLVLLCGVYSETGIWTTIALLNIAIYSELNTFLWRKQKSNKAIQPTAE